MSNNNTKDEYVADTIIPTNVKKLEHDLTNLENLNQRLRDELL